MRILIAGADGYLGWPTAMHFAARGHEVVAVDNYLRRRIARATGAEALFPNPELPERCRFFAEVAGRGIRHEVLDLCDYPALSALLRDVCPDVVVHYAEQPSAPYSMMGYEEARLTLHNNLSGTFNLIWAIVEHAPECHLIKLGTMGEYGTPNIDIEEGWLDVEHKGRRERFLYPRQGGSLYHTTKVLDTDLLWFYVRMYDVRATDLMQGPVYGLSTPETGMDRRLQPNFHYDDIFGTVVNRFLVQAVAGVPLTIYGTGGQTRGYLNVNDTLQCVELAAESPPPRGELRILNQFTEILSVNEIAATVARVGNAMGLGVKLASIPNPRKEAEDHYYNAAHAGLLELGLQPHPLTDDVVADLLEQVIGYKDLIDVGRIMPRVRWGVGRQ